MAGSIVTGKKRKPTREKNRSGEWFQGNSIFQIHQDWYTYELTETVTAQARPVQVQTRQNPTTEKGNWTSLISQEDTICNWYLLRKEKLVFQTFFRSGLMPKSDETIQFILNYSYMCGKGWVHLHEFRCLWRPEASDIPGAHVKGSCELPGIHMVSVEDILI